MSKVIIFAAPSGSGKTSIIKELLKINNNLIFSTSATTRGPRISEVDGKDYHFLSIDDFKNKIKNGEFIEYQEVYENLYYGTLKSELDRNWKENKIILFDVDVIGGINLKKIFGDSAISIFVRPPDLETLKMRLVGRNTETKESIKTRIDKATYEMGFQGNYDYILINDNFESAVLEINSVIGNFIL